MARKILKVRPTQTSAHDAKPEEWNKAQPVEIYSAHENQPHGHLIVSLPGGPKRLVEIRADEEGNLFLEFDE